MSTQDNKALVLRLYEDVFNQRDLALVDELCATNHVFHNPPTTLRGREAFKELLSLYITAFPDARFTVEDQIAEGDRVASRYTFRGTHRGDLMGIPPTGKQVTVTGIIVNRIARGKSEEGWINFDALGMLQQLGVALCRVRAVSSACSLFPTSINISHAQIKQAQALAQAKTVASLVTFAVADYVQTDFPNETFAVVWALESVCHAEHKEAF